MVNFFNTMKALLFTYYQLIVTTVSGKETI